MISILVVAGYFTGIPCRVAQTRGRRPPWYSAILGTLAAAILALVFMYQGDLVRPSTWGKNKMGTGLVVLVNFAFFCFAGAFTGLPVFLYYQNRFNRGHPKA